MMAINGKRLSEAETINLDRCYAESDRQRGLSRRAQALLAGAGESGPDMRWFVLRVAPSAEKDVDKSLAEASVESWRPMQKRIRNAPHAKRKVVYTAPVFPGYLFVKVVNCDRTWVGLLSINGVLSVLGGTLGPVAVADATLLKFKKKLEERSTDEDVVEAAFPVGASVRIEDGPFASYGGTIEQLLDGQRAVVMMAIFGRFSPIELSLAQITKAD
ncbi:MAG: transcriptional antiterminator NusG [Mesorhizobium sp.]|uniref:transcription termination/antitermination protein NusG n=1 Tax=Mesorhizobium sp. TaxID=1871066 RepID=UPI000FE8EB04|nr:transcription termination/antitermination protein NusG [Mesorhizobium sp.]RWC29829.1 MAG: transcriptional antiterminator NusG [Mesorhizobium sp.]